MRQVAGGSSIERCERRREKELSEGSQCAGSRRRLSRSDMIYIVFLPLRLRRHSGNGGILKVCGTTVPVCVCVFLCAYMCVCLCGLMMMRGGCAFNLCSVFENSLKHPRCPLRRLHAALARCFTLGPLRLRSSFPHTNPTRPHPFDSPCTLAICIASRR